VQKDCAFNGSAHFRSHFTFDLTSNKSQYRITIEDSKGAILKDFPPSSTASTALCLAHRAMYVKSRHKTFWSSPGGWGGRAINRFFPIHNDTVQVQLIRKLLSRQADYERLSPASVQQKVFAFIKRCSSPKANASLLANVSVLVMRRDKEDNIIKTQKTNNPSCTKVPLLVFSLPLTATHCHSLPLTATHCHSQPLTATHCHSLPLTATHTHGHSLPLTTTHYYSLLLTTSSE